MYHYYAFHKPYGYLSQFTDEGRWKGLHHLLDLPKDVYPLGRLDADSEGLLLLTNNRSMNLRLLDPKYRHERTYWVQVEGDAQAEQLRQLKAGVEFKAKGKTHFGKATRAKRILEPDVEERDPPIRFRKHIPTSWISITLTEGKNRQVRKMTAAVGLPTLRLIRYAIEDLSLACAPGAYQELSETEFTRLLHL